MSLILSVETPDGIVIAGDSLFTMRSSFQMKGEIDVHCPNCGHRHQEHVNTPEVPVPTTTLPYTRKLFRSWMGGEIDIALVTPFDGFQWVRQKDLSQTIEENRYD